MWILELIHHPVLAGWHFGTATYTIGHALRVVVFTQECTLALPGVVYSIGPNLHDVSAAVYYHMCRQEAGS